MSTATQDDTGMNSLDTDDFSASADDAPAVVSNGNNAAITTSTSNSKNNAAITTSTSSTSSSTNQLIVTIQNLKQLKNETTNICRSSVLYEDSFKLILTAYINKAQAIANQIRADPNLSQQQKDKFVSQLNAAAVGLNKQCTADEKLLLNSVFGKSLITQIASVGSIDYEKAIRNYLAAITAKLNEQLANCNSLNAGYFAKGINAYNANLQAIKSEFVRISPTGGNTATSGAVGQQNLVV